jgi:hypothetical protein
MGEVVVAFRLKKRRMVSCYLIFLVAAGVCKKAASWCGKWLYNLVVSTRDHLSFMVFS